MAISHTYHVINFLHQVLNFSIPFSQRSTHRIHLGFLSNFPAQSILSTYLVDTFKQSNPPLLSRNLEKSATHSTKHCSEFNKLKPYLMTAFSCQRYSYLKVSVESFSLPQRLVFDRSYFSFIKLRPRLKVKQ